MASKAQKAQVIITANGSVAKRVMEELQKSAEAAKMRMIELAAAGQQNSKAYKKAEAEFQAFNSAMRENVKDTKRVDEVMKQLSRTTNADLKRALAAATRELNKMTEGSPKRQKLIDDISRLKAQINGNNGLSMSFTQAQKQLKNLDGTSMEKLKQGLAAIKAQLDNPNIGNKWRRSLEQMQQQYQAAMAVRTAPTGVMPVAKMNTQQLGAERTALMSAIAATSGVKGYEGKTAGYEQRLKAINEQLTILSDKEKKTAADAKQLQATQEAAKTVQAVYRGQAVSLDKLNAAYQTLQARANQFAASNPAKAKVAQQQMVELKRRIDQVTAAMQAEIKIDKKFLKTATNQMLQTALSQLQQKLQSLNSTQSKAAQKLKADMKAVETQIKNNTGAIRQQGNTFGTAIKNIAAYVGVFGAFNMIKSKITEVYKSNLKLSDSLADIRKVSGLTTEEINKLYTNISKIDSRNTIETLNKLAYTGAKLGIGQNYGVEGLTGFVRAAEQVQMALGEDLGEEALPALAKLTEVMNLIPRYGVEQAMQKSASAIFQLGATSTATGKNIVEFSKRLMGLANVSRVSADELLAIGSAADAMGLMPEVAATAFNKLFTSIQKGHNLIEKSLGLVKGSINENFSQGKTIKSIVDIFDAMNKRGNMNALDGIFKDLGSDGARLVAVMTTMADRVDILKKHLATSTQAFKEGTAVINEYMIQNETAQALMQRASNLWAKAFTNPEGVDMVKSLAEQWYEVSKALTQSESSMYVFHSSLEKITNTVISLIQMLPFLIKMLTWMAVFGGIRMLVNSFIALVAAINAARTATASLQVLMNSNWVLAGLSAVVAGISLFVDHMNAAAEAAERAQKRQAELDEQLVKSKEKIDMVVAPLESYKKALDTSNKSLDERNRLLKDLLKSDYQQYLDYLGIEIDGAIDLANAYAMVVKVLKQKKAYEEREQFRDEINSTNKYERMRAGMQFGQAAKAVGAENVNQEWLRRRLVVNQSEETILQDVIQKAGGSLKAIDLGRGTQGFLAYDKNGKLINDKAIERLRKTISEFNSARVAEDANNRIVEEQYKDLVGDFDNDKFQEEIIKGQLKRKGTLENEKPDKAAIAAAKKANQDAKQAMRKEMQDAQEASTGIISKLEEYYRLQEAAINEARADGQLTEERAAEMVRSLNIMKNETLATARRAVTTGDTTEWDRLKQTILPAVLSDTSEVSRTLLDTIQRVAVDKLHAELAKFNGKETVFGLDSRAFFDQMNAKAAGNTREAARLRAKVQNEVERALLQYQFVEQANKKLRGDLETMGIITETYEQWAKRMQEGIAEKPDARVTIGQNARAEIVRQFQWDYQTRQQQPATLFNGQPNPAATVNPDDERQLQQWFQQFATNAEWASGIPQIGRWLQDGERYKTEIRQFYDSLLQIQQAARQQSEQQGPIAPLDEQALREGQQRLGDLFAHTITDEQAYRQMGNKFVDMGVLNFRYNIDNEQEARQWVKQFATDAKGDLESWAQAFPKLSEWIDIIKRQEQGETLGEAERQALEEAMPAIRNLFNEMMNHADRLDKAMKDAFQHEREQQQTQFRIAGYTDREEQADKYYANQAKQQETGAGQTFAQQLGLGSIVNDPEVLQIQNRIYWRNEEVKNAYAQLEALKSIQQMRLDMMRENGASEAELAAMEQQQAQDRAGLELLLADRQTALFDQTNNLVTKTMQLMQKRAQSINTLTKPIQDGAQNIGKKFGEMIRGVEEDSMTWAEIWHSMAQAVGDSIIDMMAQYAQNMLMEKMMNQQSREDAIKTASVKVPAGIASGAAETVGQLGWWGLALIPVIAAVLHGLLAAAFASNKQNDTSKSSVTKVKLASGMLTYDSGNVSTLASGKNKMVHGTSKNGTSEAQIVHSTSKNGTSSYLGQDGRVYTAKEELAPKTGLITHPIATTVQGQPALVAERGPEIVIGRRTTKRIQMAAPELLHAIQLIDRGYMPRLRTYDEGNVGMMAQLPAPQQGRGAEGGEGSLNSQIEPTLAALTQTVALLSSTVADLQRKGIPAHINKYGTGGLIDEVKSGLRFDARYNRG